MCRLRASRLILGLPALLSLGVSAVPQARKGLWLDEVYSLLLSRGQGYVQWQWPKGDVLPGLPDPASLAHAGSLLGIWTHQSQDAHPPLYFVLLRLWRELFGSGVFVARAYSLLCMSLATLFVTLAILRLTRRPWPAVLGGSVVALSIHAGWYAQEIRDYAQLLLSISVFLFAHAGMLIRPSRAAPWAYAAAAVFCGLTHYLAFGVVAPLILTLLIAIRRSRRRDLIAALATAAAFYVAIWGLWAMPQVRNSAGMAGWALGHATSLLARALSFLAAPGRAAGAPFAGAWPLGATLLTIVLLQSFRRSGRRRWLWASAGLATFGPIALLLAGDLAAGGVTSWWTRYLLPTLPGAAITTGLLAAQPGRVRWLAAAFPLVALLSQFDRQSLEVDYPTVVRESRELGSAAATAFVVPDKTNAGDIETSVRTLAMMYAAHSHGVQGPVILMDQPSPRAATLGETILVVSAWGDFSLDDYFPGYHLTQRSRLFPVMGIRLLHLARSAPPATRPHPGP